MITKKELILRIIDLEDQMDWAINEIERLTKESRKLKKGKKNEVKK